MKLNLGCGTDVRSGYVNIDASTTLPGVDVCADLSLPGTLLEHYKPNSIDSILANDILEHLFHWEAVSLLSDCICILKPQGTIKLRVPDFDFILHAYMDPSRKITLLFGGQDIPQGNPVMDESRKRNPSLFCHKYAYTSKSLEQELTNAGFNPPSIVRVATNIVAVAQKP